MENFPVLLLALGALLATAICGAQTPSFTTSQCGANRPPNTANFFSNGVSQAFSANCSETWMCAEKYCACANSNLTSVDTGRVICSASVSAVSCSSQTSCTADLTECLWLAAYAARNVSGGTDACATWGAPLMQQLRDYANIVTNGTDASLAFAGGTNVGKSCSWFTCSFIANSSAAPCTIYPDVSCAVPLSIASMVTSASDSSLADTTNFTSTSFSLTITGDFSIFFSDSLENGKLRKSFTDDLKGVFQTENVILTKFANGSLESEFAVMVPTNNRMARQLVSNAAGLMSSSAAWLHKTQTTYKTQNAAPLATPTAAVVGTSTVINTPTTLFCGKVCFQMIVILGGAAVLVLFLLSACYCCCSKRKTSLPQREWESKAPSGAGTAVAAPPAAQSAASSINRTASANRL
jgi:hypothetical protein